MNGKTQKWYESPRIKMRALQPENAFALSLPIDDDTPVDPGTAETPAMPQNKNYVVWDEEEEQN